MHTSFPSRPFGVVYYHDSFSEEFRNYVAIVCKRKKEVVDQDDLQKRARLQPKRFGEGDSWCEEIFCSSDESEDIIRELDEQIEFLPREQFKFKIFNAVNLLPRDKAFYGDVDSNGSYPLFRYEAQKDAVYPEVKAWPPILERLRNVILKKTGQRCNHCVVNQYRDQNDHIGFHFDKTRDFASGTSVLTLSFGAERLLRLKHNKTGAKEDIYLKAGSLFVLGPKTNSIWKHSIIKRKRQCNRRISLTYRLIKTIKHPDGALTEIDKRSSDLKVLDPEKEDER